MEHAKRTALSRRGSERGTSQRLVGTVDPPCRPPLSRQLTLEPRPGARPGSSNRVAQNGAAGFRRRPGQIDVAWPGRPGRRHRRRQSATASGRLSAPRNVAHPAGSGDGGRRRRAGEGGGGAGAASQESARAATDQPGWVDSGHAIDDADP